VHPGDMPPQTAGASPGSPADCACASIVPDGRLVKIYDADEWADNNGHPPWCGKDGRLLCVQGLQDNRSGDDLGPMSSSPGRKLFTYMGPKGNQVSVPVHPKDWNPKMTKPHRDRVAKSKVACRCSICQLPPVPEKEDTSQEEASEASTHHSPAPKWPEVPTQQASEPIPSITFNGDMKVMRSSLTETEPSGSDEEKQLWQHMKAIAQYRREARQPQPPAAGLAPAEKSL
jgi:hypothetical protein